MYLFWNRRIFPDVYKRQALQIVTFAGYQECVNGESMMPMWVFAVLQLLVLMYLCVKLLKEAKVVDLCVRKNWNI